MCLREEAKVSLVESEDEVIVVGQRNKENKQNVEGNTRYCFVSEQDMVNYIFGMHIYVFLKFNGRIDEQLLEKAVHKTVEIEPILGCRYIEDPMRPYWEESSHGEGMNFFSMETTNEVEKAYQEFMEQSEGNKNNELVEVKLIRAETDYLFIRLNHACSDVGGVKEYLQLLSLSYTLASQNSKYEISVIEKSERSQRGVFENLGMKNPIKEFNEERIDPPKWSFPFKNGMNESPKSIFYQFDQEEYRSLKNYAKKCNATFNDLLLTAYYRALSKLIRPSEHEYLPISTTIDIRRYLSKDTILPICNMSSAFGIKVQGVELDQRFEDTLLKISKITSELKENLPGVNEAILFEILYGMGYENAKSNMEKAREYSAVTNLRTPLLSNFGVISKGPVRFAETEATEGFVNCSAIGAPDFYLFACTYNDILTLSVRFYQSTTSEQDVKKLLEDMKTELISLTKQ